MILAIDIYKIRPQNIEKNINKNVTTYNIFVLNIIYQ